MLGDHAGAHSTVPGAGVGSHLNSPCIVFGVNLLRHKLCVRARPGSLVRTNRTIRDSRVLRIVLTAPQVSTRRFTARSFSIRLSPGLAPPSTRVKRLGGEEAGRNYSAKIGRAGIRCGTSYHEAQHGVVRVDVGEEWR